MIGAEVEADIVAGFAKGYNALTELGDRVEDGYEPEDVEASEIHYARTLIWQAIDKLGIGKAVLSGGRRDA